ncbi:MAG TPA: DinB family protein [Ktedonobacterales bacterium]
MTTLPDRYADLTDLAGAKDDPAAVQLLDRLDQALGPHSAPVGLRTALDRLLHERIAAAAPALAPTVSRAPGILTRRDALKVAAASMAWLLTLGQTGPEVAEELVRLAQEGPMTGPRLVGLIDAERTRWHALLSEVGAARMEQPGVEGDWSVKELVAHLTFYERRVIESGQRVLASGKFTRPDDDLAAMTMDERNAVVAAQARARPVADVLAEADQVFGLLRALIAHVPQDILNDPRRLGMPEDEDVAPWMRVANNSYGHYRQHEQAIRDWLERTRQGGEA